MRNLLFTLVLFVLSANSFSQNVEENEQNSSQNTETTSKFDSDENLGRNEISLNAFNLVAFGILDVTYERIISENSSWALEGFIHADKDKIDEAYYKNFSLTGKYKHFFSRAYARGFYVHGFGMLSKGEYRDGSYYDYENDIYYSDDEDYTDFAIGFGLGGKFVSSGGFLLDLNAGIGRNLFSSNSPEIIGQFMVNLGYRF